MLKIDLCILDIIGTDGVWHTGDAYLFPYLPVYQCYWLISHNVYCRRVKTELFTV